MQHRDGLADPGEPLAAQVGGRAVSVAIELGPGGHDLVEQLALAMLFARVGVGVCERDRLSEGAAALGPDHDHPGGRRPLRDQIPLLLVERRLRRHRPSVMRRRRRRITRIARAGISWCALGYEQRGSSNYPIGGGIDLRRGVRYAADQPRSASFTMRTNPMP